MCTVVQLYNNHDQKKKKKKKREREKLLEKKYKDVMNHPLSRDKKVREHSHKHSTSNRIYIIITQQPKQSTFTVNSNFIPKIQY